MTRSVSKHCADCGVEILEAGATDLCPTCLATDLFSTEDELIDGALGKIGDYHLLEQIGEGGFGIVYRAGQVDPVEREVALKVLKPGMDSREVVSRFGMERQSLAMLDHPNVSTVYDGGATEDGRPFFVMELVEGVPISDYCDTHRLNLRDRLVLFLEVCEGVQHAHQKGVVHRDIKPANVLVGERDDSPVPKVIDFGIAKAIDQRAEDRRRVTTLSGQVCGTPDYMSPEQISGSSRDIDVRTDVYSLGALLYELITGMPPFGERDFASASIAQIEDAITNRDPCKPSARLGDPYTGRLPDDLDWIILKALEKDPARRYSSVGGLIDDVRRHLGDEPVTARPPSMHYRAGKFFKRLVANRMALAASVLAFVLLVSGMGGIVWEWSRAERNAAIADGERVRAQTALQKLRLQVANRLLRQDRAGEALAHLARSLREDPENRVIATRIVSALSRRDFALPWCRTLNHSAAIFDIAVSRDGKRLAVGLSNQPVTIWNLESLSRELEIPQNNGRRLRFSRDGSRLLVGSDSAVVRIWDAVSGEPLIPDVRHTKSVTHAKFSPDEKSFITASTDGTARIWNASTGKPISPNLKHDGSVTNAGFSLDGSRVLTSSYDRSVKVWSAKSGELLLNIDTDFSVLSARFTRDGRFIGTTAYEKVARLWDSQDGKLKYEFPHDGIVRNIFFDDENEIAVTIGQDQVVKVWKLENGELSMRLSHSSWVKSARLSPDDSALMTIGDDSSIHVWDLGTGRPLIEPIRYGSNLVVAEFLPDGDRIVTAQKSGEVNIWDIRRGSSSPISVRHSREIVAASFNRDGGQFLTGSRDGSAQVWDSKTAEPVGPRMRHDSWVLSADFHPDGRKILTSSLDRTARVWDSSTGSELVRVTHEDRVPYAEFSPDGATFVTSSYDKTARVWNSTTGAPVSPAPFKHDRQIWHASFDPTGERVATSSYDFTVKIWDAATAEMLAPPIRLDNLVISAVFSPDGKHIVNGLRNGDARLHDWRSGRELFALDHSGEVKFPVFGRGGMLVASGSMDNTAKIWNTVTGKQHCPKLRHTAEVIRVSFSRDGIWVATASRDGSARVWHVDSGEPATEPFLHEDAVSFANFDPTRMRLLTAGDDGVAKVWSLPIFDETPPKWLPDLAEAVCGRRLESDGTIDRVDYGGILDLKEQSGDVAVGKHDRPSYNRWLSWFLDDRSVRNESF